MKLQRLVSLIGFLILAYMLNSIGLQKIALAVRSMDVKYLAGFFLVLAGTVALKGLKWKMSLSLFGIRIASVKAIEMWGTGFFIGAVTPGRVGDFAKIFYLKEKKSKTLGAALLDRFTDVFAVAIFAVMGVSVFGRVVGLTYEMVLLGAAAVVFAFAWVKKHRHAVAELFLKKIVPEKYRAILRTEMADFYQSFRQAARNRTGLLKIAAVAVITWMISAVQGLFIAKSLGISISYFMLLLIVSIVALVELIPVTVAGLGTREAGVVVLMSFLGIDSSQALVFSLSGFIFGYLALTSFGYLMWLKNPIKFGFKKEL